MQRLSEETAAFLPRWASLGKTGLPLPSRSSIPFHPQTTRSLFFAALSLFLLIASFLLGRSTAPFQPSAVTCAPIPFLLPSHSIPPLREALQPEDEPVDPTLDTPPARIPNVVHYVFGLAGDRGLELKYFQYLAMRSALLTLRPSKIYFHHGPTLPQGYWFEQIRPHLTLVRAREVNNIFGQPIEHYAHKADVLRLEVLLKYGGIYMDIDVFALRDFVVAGLLQQKVVMGLEGSTDSGAKGLEPKGLCNAIIVAEPNARFVRDWLQLYTNFDDSNWDNHSILLPWRLARQNPEEITVLGPTAMFYPLWDKASIRLVHEDTSYDFEATGQLGYHAWESLAKAHLNTLDPTTLRTRDSSFTRMARRFSGGREEEERWLEWKRTQAGL